MKVLFWFLILWCSKALERQCNAGQEMVFTFPRQGESVIMLCNDYDDLCRGDVVFAGYTLSNVISANGFEIRFLYSNQSVVALISSVGPLFSYTIYLTLPRNTVLLPVSFQIRNLDTDNIIYASEQITLVVTIPSDFGITALLPAISSRDIDVWDFFELGTSNFNTVSHAAAEIIKSRALSSVRGIAVEIVAQYLASVPVIDGVQKINAGIVLSDIDEMIAVYYLPESIVEKVSIGYYIKGCTSVNKVDSHILQLLAAGQLSPEVVLKTFVPGLTIGRLLNESVLPGQRLRLLKTDMEGMDQPVLHQMLDHYQSRTGSSTITGEYPCVVYFETRVNAAPFRDETLFARLVFAGYVFFEDLFEGDANDRSENDAMVVNCLCGREDFTIALSLLAPAVYDVDSVVSVC